MILGYITHRPMTFHVGDDTLFAPAAEARHPNLPMEAAGGEPVVKGGPGSGPRPGAGRKAAVDLYHGTAAAYVESIKQNGLVVHQENRDRLMRDKALHRGERGQAVYVTPNAKDAELYGQAAAAAAYWKQPEDKQEKGKQRYLFGDKKYPIGPNPVIEVAVLHFRIPTEVAATFKPDRYDNLGSPRGGLGSGLPTPRGGLLAPSKLDAKYLVGYTVIKKEEYDKPISVTRHAIKDNNTDLFAVTTCISQPSSKNFEVGALQKPLIQSGSKDAIGANIRAELSAGKPRDQAIAIALSVQRQAKGKKAARARAKGFKRDGRRPYSRSRQSTAVKEKP